MDDRSEDRQAGLPAARSSLVERAAEKLKGAKGGPPADASAPAAPPFPVAEPAGPGLVEEGLEEALAAGAAGAPEAASGPGGEPPPVAVLGASAAISGRAPVRPSQRRSRIVNIETTRLEARHNTTPANKRTRTVERSEGHTADLQSLMRISYAVL